MIFRTGEKAARDAEFFNTLLNRHFDKILQLDLTAALL